MTIQHAHTQYAQFENQSTSIARPGISEIIIPTPELNAAELTLPMLAHLSRQSQNRWVTMVGLNALTKQTLTEYGFKADNVRNIQSQSDEETLWIMWEALNNGTSDFVVAAFDHALSVTNRERNLLRTASIAGHARGLVLKSLANNN